MIFDFFLVIFWLLAFVLPVGDYHKYIKSLSDPRITAPDKPAHVVSVSELVLSVLPAAPAPLPRYSPLVVPLYNPVEAMESTPTRFMRTKRVFAAFKWVDVFLTHITNLIGRPRPTKTSHLPTKVFVPMHPTPPTPGSRVLDATCTSAITAGPGFDLVALWDAYKLILPSSLWSDSLLALAPPLRIPPAFLTTTPIPPDDSAAASGSNPDPEALPTSYGPIIDICPLIEFPAVTYDVAPHPNLDNHGKTAPEDVPLPAITEDELIEVTDPCSSAPNDAAHALSTWIDTKTGVEGPTDTYGASGGGKTLEPAVSTGSINNIVRPYAGKSSLVTPSPSDSSIARSTDTPLLDPEPFPAGVRVHVSQHLLLLESLITPVTAMERRRHFYGRANGSRTDNPDLPGTFEHAASLQGIPRLNLVPTEGSRRSRAEQTEAPLIYFSPELIYSMKNVSSLIPTEYYFGLNWIDPNNFTNLVLVAETVDSTLGDDLLALQLGSEPDLYDRHGKRPQNPYTFDLYMNELQQAVTQLNAAPAFTNRDILLAPSSCCFWNETQLFEAGRSIDFLRHGNSGLLPVSMVNPYRSTSVAQQYNKPLVMLETDTASCGGFPDISDSFGAALWSADLLFQLAAANFSQALFHVGGQNVYYNSFTPPPTNQSTFHQSTTSAIYYAALVTAEAFGLTGNSQIVDLFMNGNNDYTPGYAIYENGNPSKVVLFNHITDAGGANDYVAHIAVLAEDRRARLLLPPTRSKSGQTMGDQFNSDGRMKGEMVTETIQCDTAAGSCPIAVKAPSIVLVFLNDQTLADSTPPNEGPQTFATTAATKIRNTATVDQAILATSNGRGGGKYGGGMLGSTSLGSISSAWRVAVPGMVAVIGGALGAAFVAFIR
ncbi:hypothetical protein FRC11_000282 [Ceratobasidium sp. 423]|nr:hypothetical protein FRC11_000282 [Ceratobasidium sp. 423]